MRVITLSLRQNYTSVYSFGYEFDTDVNSEPPRMAVIQSRSTFFCEKNVSLNNVHGRTLFNSLFAKALEERDFFLIKGVIYD